MFDLTLSFDNGPEPEATPQVLDILRRRGIRSSFFVIGEKLADPARRALAERAHAEGHWIGNHTFTHRLPLGERDDPDTGTSEIGRTQALIGDLACNPPLFRPFGGGGALGPHLLNRPALDHLQQGSFTCVLWNAIPRDWEDPEGWVDRALAQCREQEWTLTVLHDLPTGAMERLERFLDLALEAGARPRQNFPEDCLPIRSGQVMQPLESFVSERPG